MSREESYYSKKWLVLILIYIDILVLIGFKFLDSLNLVLISWRNEAMLVEEGLADRYSIITEGSLFCLSGLSLSVWSISVCLVYLYLSGLFLSVWSISVSSSGPG